MVAAIVSEPPYYAPPRSRELRFDWGHEPPEPPEDSGDDDGDDDWQPPNWRSCLMPLLFGVWVALSFIAIEFDINFLKPVAMALLVAMFVSIPSMILFAFCFSVWHFLRGRKR